MLLVLANSYWLNSFWIMSFDYVAKIVERIDLASSTKLYN